MIESQSSICSWADATFGPPVSDASIAARALVEMAELVTACVNGEPAERIGEEIADVVIVLARLGRSVGVDVAAAATDARPLRRLRSVQHAAEAIELLTELLCAVDQASNWAGAALRDSVGELVDHAACVGVSLPSAIDAKMAINRARRWERDGNGHGRHVK